MKFYETHFEDYINASEKQNLHPKFKKQLECLPSECEQMKNIIVYGAAGIGKYTQTLNIIKHYSPSKLKYEKKISIVFNKQPFFFKISDIHYEVDMSLLGCNAKLLWNELFTHIVDVISTKKRKHGIIVCKHFHEIHSELLEIFYSYMQTFYKDSISISFILITEHISFIPDNIVNCCKVFHLSRPTKTAYNKCFPKKLGTQQDIKSVTNIKLLKTGFQKEIDPYKNLCLPIVENMINIEDLKFLQFRDLLYDLFIYNLSIDECVWFILFELSKRKQIKKKDMYDILIHTYKFFKLFNNNYRPIYHLESYMLYLTRKIHGLPEGMSNP